LLGGSFGRLEGSQENGSVLKNWRKKKYIYMYVEHRITTTDFNDLMHAKEKKVVLKERKKERKICDTYMASKSRGSCSTNLRF
jgi:hypothetical protein